MKQHREEWLNNLNDEETSKIYAIFRERYSTVDFLKAKLYDSVLETL